MSDFLTQVMAGDDFGHIEAIFHEGACSATTGGDGKYMMLNNYEYSKELLHYCVERNPLSICLFRRNVR
ncbi:hypothetical protein O9992_10280 [Vibrio lentus]|nr:hypothetical protein [Vibrio lentus]